MTRLTFTVLVGIAVVIFAAYILIYVLKEDPNIHSVALEKNWTVTFEGKSYTVEDLSTFRLPRTVAHGDTVIFENTIPTQFDSCVGMTSVIYLSAMEVSLDDKILYSYGMDLYENSKMVGSGLHYIFFPPHVAGKHLKITVYVNTWGAFTSMPMFEMFNSPFVTIANNNKYGVIFALCIFILIFGCIIAICSLCIIFFERKIYRFLLIGLQAFLLGIWGLCYMKEVMFFSLDFELNCALEYMTLYLAPIPFILLLMDARKGLISKKRMLGLRCFLIFNIVFVLMVVLLALFGVSYFSPFLTTFHSFILVLAVYIVGFKIFFVKNVDLSEEIYAFGIMLFCIFCVMDLLRYALVHYFEISNDVLNVTVLPLGALMFMICLVASYVAYMYKNLADKTQKDLLAQLAYRDSLTGLFNRAKGDQITKILDDSNANYAFISIDMNGLKSVNDTYGHIDGDNFIVAFADILKKAFAGVGTVLRTGGDEFLVIIRSEHLKDIDESIKKMIRLESEAPDLPVQLEASYGIAYYGEMDGDKLLDNTKAVFNKADARMYAMKKRLKKGI